MATTTYTNTPVLVRENEKGEVLLGVEAAARRYPVTFRLTPGEKLKLRMDSGGRGLTMSSYVYEVLAGGWDLAGWAEVLETDRHAVKMTERYWTASPMRLARILDTSLLPTGINKERYLEQVYAYISQGEEPREARTESVVVYLDSYAAVMMSHAASELGGIPIASLVRAMVLRQPLTSAFIVSRARSAHLFEAVAKTIRNGGIRQVSLTHITKSCGRCADIKKSVKPLPPTPARKMSVHKTTTPVGATPVGYVQPKED